MMHLICSCYVLPTSHAVYRHDSLVHSSRGHLGCFHKKQCNKFPCTSTFIDHKNLFAISTRGLHVNLISLSGTSCSPKWLHLSTCPQVVCQGHMSLRHCPKLACCSFIMLLSLVGIKLHLFLT